MLVVSVAGEGAGVSVEDGSLSLNFAHTHLQQSRKREARKLKRKTYKEYLAIFFLWCEE